MSARAAGSMSNEGWGGVLLERIATFVFCLSAVSFGWWLGGGFSVAENATPTVTVRGTPPIQGRYFLCSTEADCDEAYDTYLDTERARALAWRHGGP